MDEEITLDLKDIFYVLKKRAKLILIITFGCTLLSGILSFFVIKPTYEAKASIVIGKANVGDKTQNSYNDIMMFQKLVKTYAQIGQSTSVVDKVAAKLNNKDITSDKLQKMVVVTPQADTQIVDFKVDNKNPQEAYLIINAVTDAFMQEAKRIYPDGSIQIMDGAKVPEKPVKPKKALNVAIAFFIGLMASVGFTFVLEFMDNTIKTEEDINRYLGIPVIGIIPKSMEPQNN